MLDATVAKSEQKCAKKFEDLEGPVDPKLEALERRMAKQLEDNKRSGNSVSSRAGCARTEATSGHRQGSYNRTGHRPHFVDIKGLCEYRDRLTKGVPGHEAVGYVTSLLEAMPEYVRAMWASSAR